MGVRKEDKNMKAYDKIPEWNELIFVDLTSEDEDEDEGEGYGWSYTVENLPTYGEEVLVTDGEGVWMDSFDVDKGLYLSGTDSEIDCVIAWMPLPNPYKGD